MSPKKRKRHLISLSPEEFAKLRALKESWEDWTGEHRDWGAFLMQVTASSSGGPPNFSVVPKEETEERQENT